MNRIRSVSTRWFAASRAISTTRNFLSSGMVEASRLQDLVGQVPDSAFARYPSLSPGSVRQAIEPFLKEEG